MTEPTPAALAAAMEATEEPRNKRGEPPNWRYRCDVCGEGFASSQKKAAHVRTTGHGKGKGTDSAPAGPKKSSSQLERKLRTTFAGIGVVVYPADNFCGQHILTRAEPLAVSLDQLAQENPSVKRTLEMLVEGTAWSSAVLQLLMLALPILAHHGALPDVPWLRLMAAKIAGVPEEAADAARAEAVESEEEARRQAAA